LSYTRRNLSAPGPPTSSNSEPDRTGALVTRLRRIVQASVRLETGWMRAGLPKAGLNH